MTVPDPRGRHQALAGACPAHPGRQLATQSKWELRCHQDGTPRPKGARATPSPPSGSDSVRTPHLEPTARTSPRGRRLPGADLGLSL